MAFAERRNYVFETEFVSHLIKDINIAAQFQFAFCYVGVAGFEAQNLFRILLVSYAHVHVLHKIGHNLLRLFR